MSTNLLVTGQLISTLATGTAPITAASTTSIANLLPKYTTGSDAIKSATTTIDTVAASAPIQNYFLASNASTTSALWKEAFWGTAYATTVTANTSTGTLSLGIGTMNYQITGSTAGFVITFPSGAAASPYLGIRYHILNKSTQTITIKSYDASTVTTMATNTSYIFINFDPSAALDTPAAWNNLGPLGV